MKKIKKEIEVVACELCGLELGEMTIIPMEIVETKKAEKGKTPTDIKHYFHRNCVNKFLLETVKEKDED